MVFFSPLLFWTILPNGAYSQTESRASRMVSMPHSGTVTPYAFARALQSQLYGLHAYSEKEALRVVSSLDDISLPANTSDLQTPVIEAQLIARQAIRASIYDVQNIAVITAILAPVSSSENPQLGREVANYLKRFVDHLRLSRRVTRFIYKVPKMDGRVIFDGSRIMQPEKSSVPVMTDAQYNLFANLKYPNAKVMPAPKISPAAVAIGIWKGDQGSRTRDRILIPTSSIYITDTFQWMENRLQSFAQALGDSSSFVGRSQISSFVGQLGERIQKAWNKPEIDDMELLEISAEIALAMTGHLELQEGMVSDNFIKRTESEDGSKLVRRNDVMNIDRIKGYQPGALVIPFVQHGTEQMGDIDDVDQWNYVFPYPVHFVGVDNAYNAFDGDPGDVPDGLLSHDLGHAYLVAKANTRVDSEDSPIGSSPWLQTRLQLHENYKRAQREIASDRMSRLVAYLWNFIIREDNNVPYDRKSIEKILSESWLGSSAFTFEWNDPFTLEGRNLYRFWSRIGADNDIGPEFREAPPTTSEIEDAANLILAAIGSKKKSVHLR